MTKTTPKRTYKKRQPKNSEAGILANESQKKPARVRLNFYFFPPKNERARVVIKARNLKEAYKIYNS